MWNKIIFIIFMMLNLPYVFAFENDLDIDSKKLTINKKYKYAEFSGNVIVNFDDSILKTEKLYIYYTDEKKGNKFKRIKITTPLKIYKKTGEIILGDKAEYDMIQSKLTIMGDVSILQEKNILKTEKLIYIGKISRK